MRGTTVSPTQVEFRKATTADGDRVNAMSNLPSIEDIQSQILSTLASSSSGSIPDTRQLEHDGVTLQSGEQQAVVKSVLDSLASREVRALLNRHDVFIMSTRKYMALWINCLSWYHFWYFLSIDDRIYPNHNHLIYPHRRRWLYSFYRITRIQGLASFACERHWRTSGNTRIESEYWWSETLNLVWAIRVGKLKLGRLMWFINLYIRNWSAMKQPRWDNLERLGISGLQRKERALFERWVEDNGFCFTSFNMKESYSFPW